MKKTPPKDEKKVTDIEARILELETQLEESDVYKTRALADLENFKRREGENKKNWSQFAVIDFIKKVVPNFLELSRGAEHSKDEAMTQVVSKFFTNLETQGLTQINPQAGDEMDPEKHEVLMLAEGEKGKIVQTLESGWMFQEKVIIPAKVSAAAN